MIKITGGEPFADMLTLSKVMYRIGYSDKIPRIYIYTNGRILGTVLGNEKCGGVLRGVNGFSIGIHEDQFMTWQDYKKLFRLIVSYTDVEPRGIRFIGIEGMASKELVDRLTIASANVILLPLNKDCSLADEDKIVLEGV